MNLKSRRRSPDLFIPALLMVLVFLLAARTPLDTDLWWHLAAGKQTWQSGWPMVTDVFSFTRFGQPWISHSWLTEWILYGLFQWGGTLAIGAWMAGLATIGMGFMFGQMRGPAIFRAFLVVLASTVAAVVWSPRPQLVSLVAFSLLSWILYRYKWQKIRQLWMLPVIFLLWSNLHGGWALGFMLLGLMIVGEVLNHMLGNRSPEVVSWQGIQQLVMWGLLSVPVLVINPNGLQILKIPFQTVGVQVLQQFIQEWASPNFHELYQQPYLWMLGILLAAFGLSGRKVDVTELLVVIWFGILGLVARRNFGPFALAATPVLSRYLWAAYRNWRDPEWIHPGGWGAGQEQPLPARYRPRWQRIVNLALVGLFGFGALLKLWIVTYPVLVASNSAQTNPVMAVDFMKQHAVKGRIFNEYNWGGYLIWSDQELQVFVDGRTDLYGDELLGEWIQIIQAEPGWQKRLSDWRVNWVLVEPARPLADALKVSGWRIAYQDDLSILFQRVSGP